MADSILPYIAALLSHLDPSTNPYDQAEAFLKDALYPATQRNFRTHIYVLLALFGR